LEDIVRNKLAYIAGTVADRLDHPDADFNRERFLEQTNPQDLQGSTLRPSLTPTAALNREQSSLPRPLRYAVGNTLPASKDQKAKGWLCAEAFERYLGGDETVEINGGEASRRLRDF
jgi:hypothetical protein